MKRDIKGPLPVRVRVRFRLSGILFGFPFLKFCSLAFFPGFNLLYTAEIRGQPLVLLYKMILSVCVHCAGWPEKTAGPICKIFLGVIDSSMGIVRKIVKFHIS